LPGDLRRFALALGDDGKAVGLEDDVFDVRDHVIPEDDEVTVVGPDALLLCLGDLEEDVALPQAAFAHNVHVRVLWARLIGLLNLLVELPVGGLVLADPLVSKAHGGMIFASAGYAEVMAGYESEWDISRTGGTVSVDLSRIESLSRTDVDAIVAETEKLLPDDAVSIVEVNTSLGNRSPPSGLALTLKALNILAENYGKPLIVSPI
jgi:hypothetical protein